MLFFTKRTHANRGTVAVVCWNTLQAPTWYVDAENLDGEVSLGKDDNTLLAINFSEFTTLEGDFKEVEELEIVKANIDDRQLVLDASVFGTATEVKDYDFAKVPSKNKDEKSYKDGDTVYVYVPEEICEDLETLKNKTITLVLGDDNIAALIIVEDDVVDADYLTKYASNKITVGGTEYKLASDYTVELNGVNHTYTLATGVAVTADPKCPVCEVAKGSNHDADCEENGYVRVANPLDAALKVVLGQTYDAKNIEKRINTTVILDEDDKVESIELFVSGTFANTAEAVVTKVKETKSAYTIYTTGKNITWQIDDEEDLDFPTVYVDGVKSDIRDIEAGNVITVIIDPDCDNDIQYNSEYISKIYASTNVVTGEATKVKKSNNAITVDGEVYPATDMLVAKKMTTDELKDNKFNVEFDSKKVLDNEEVTLYLNIFGEYVAVSLEEAATTYTFGVVTYISSTVTFDGEDEEIAVRNFKVLLPDGTKKTHKLTVNTEDDDIDDAVKTAVQDSTFDMFAEGDFLMFEADADRKIEIEKLSDIQILNDISTSNYGKIADTDYIIAQATADSVDKDDAEFKFVYATNPYDAEYSASETVIFNRYEKEIISKWKSIVVDGSTDGKYDLATNTFVIFEKEDEDVPLYIVANIPEDNYSSSDSVYALIDNSAYKMDSEWYVDFVGSENVEVKDGTPVETLTNIDGWLVEYAMSASKISEAYKLVDVTEFQSNDTKDSTALSTLVAARAPITTVSTTVTLADGEEITVDADDFSDKVDDKAGTYTFTYDGSAWKLDGTAATLAEYGITSTAATLATDNTITVRLWISDTVVAWGTTAPTTVEQIELDEVKVATSGKITLKFVETDADNNNTTDDVAISDVKLDKDEIKVYDLRNGSVEEIDIDDVKLEVEDGEAVYVIPAYNSDADLTEGVNLLFIVK